MQGSEHGNRGDGGTGEIRCDVLRDAGKAEDVDVQHLAGSLRRLEIRAGVVPQPEIEAFAGRGLLHHVGVTFELIADCRTDEIGPVGIKPVLHYEVDVAQVYIADGRSASRGALPRERFSHVAQSGVHGMSAPRGGTDVGFGDLQVR
jgi:hypothetical protein